MKVRKSTLQKAIKEMITEIIGSSTLGISVGSSYSGRARNSLSKKSKPKNNKILVIGDSQIGGELGRALSEKYSGRISYKHHQDGSGTTYWIKNWDSRIGQIISGSCPGVIIISLGGNPDGSSDPEGLIKKIRDTCDSGIVWSGAPPAEDDKAGRKTRNKTIDSSLNSMKNTQFINPFDFIKKNDGTSGWEGGNNNVHLTYSAATEYLLKAPFPQ